jgi:cardiolipin synthase
MEPWSLIQIFHTGDAYYESLIDRIRHAKKSITIEGYIFSIDRLTSALLEELSMARKRGCLVKIIIDGFGSYNQIPELKKICLSKGIEFRVFHPLPYFSKKVPRWNELMNLNFPLFFRRMNRRNHRKIVLIDEIGAYLGSMNFTEQHCEKYVGQKAWRDTGVYLEGPAVKHLAIAVQITYLRTVYRGILTWVNRWMLPRPSFSAALQLNTTQKMRRALYRDLLRLINQAQRRIYITTAYFLPKRKLLKALIDASNRGVDVILILPGKSDVPLVKWAAFYTIQLLLLSRIPIYEYKGSVLHAKNMIVDDTAYIGSFNLNHRSLLHDLEVIARFHDPASLENMLNQWELDLANSVFLKEKDHYSTWLSQWFYKIAFLLRYLL